MCCLIHKNCLQRRTPSQNGGPPLEFINQRGNPPLDFINQMGVCLQNSSTYSHSKEGPPLEFINIQPQKGGLPLKFINIQPQIEGPPLEFIKINLKMGSRLQGQLLWIYRQLIKNTDYVAMCSCEMLHACQILSRMFSIKFQSLATVWEGASKKGNMSQF